MKKRHIPHPMDVALGARLRMCREEAGVTLHNVAAECGITFQQVQKYENGRNRISFSRLVEYSNSIGVGVITIIGPLAGTSEQTDQTVKFLNLTQDPATRATLLALQKIKNPILKEALVHLIETMAK